MRGSLELPGGKVSEWWRDVVEDERDWEGARTERLGYL